MVSGGTKPYNYQWSDQIGGNPNPNTPALAPGTYTCSVSDSNGCIVLSSVTIIEPGKISIEFATTPATCHNNDGSATVHAQGGTGNLTFLWTHNGEESETINNVSSGEYTVNVIDENGCSVFGTANIKDADGPSVNKNIGPVTCFGGGGNGIGAIPGGGKIELIVNGNPPFTCNWSNDETGTVISGISAGMYIAKILDNDGCIVYDTTVLDTPNPFQSILTITNNNCGFAQGKVVASLTGGLPPFNYAWSCSSLNQNIIGNLIGGTEGTLKVTDANSCQTYASFRIFDTDGPSVTLSVLKNEICFLGGNGSIQANVSGGHPPYSYVWSPSGGNSAISNNLLADEYTVTVKDSLGCVTVSTPAILNSPNKLEVTVDKMNPSTPLGNDGKAFSTVFGGTPPYSYLWNTGSTDQKISGLNLSSNKLTVTDANGCSVQAISGPPGHYPPNGFCPYNNSTSICIDTSGCPGCITVMRNITDFGADGSDDVSDECAFELAASFFASLDSATIKILNIQAGTYYIGRQNAGGGWLLKGHDVLSFYKVSNLTIQGDVNPDGTPASILRTNPCMYYGAFEPSTMNRYISYIWWGLNPLNTPYILGPNQFDTLATVGDMLSLIYCHRITINNLEMDGNIDHTIIGGGYTEGMQQGGYSGIYLNSSRYVTINNVYVHHFGYDGITLRDTWCPFSHNGNPNLNIYAHMLYLRINRSIFTYNARNNMTWASGMGVTVYGCKFTHAGQSRYTSSPGCGLDIEYESNGGQWGHGNSYGFFKKCEFSYNHDIAMSSQWDNPHTYKHTFEDCLFLGFISTITSSSGMTFNRCNFVGTLSSFHSAPIAYSSQVNDKNTKFLSCNFYEEWNVPGVGRRSFQQTIDESGGACLMGTHGYLLNVIGSRQVFDKCKTETNYTMKDAAFNDDSLPNWQSFNKTQVHKLKLSNFGLNGCDCDHELSSMANCNFIGNYNGNIIPMDITQPNYAGLRNCPVHPTPVYPATHFNNHHGYHGVLSVFNDFSVDSVISLAGGFILNPGGFTQDYCFPCNPLRDSVPKYEHLICPTRVNDLLSATQPYYTAINHADPTCFDPLRRRDNKTIPGYLSVFPNPTSNYLLIDNLPADMTIRIRNILGKDILIKISGGGQEEIDINDILPGVYFINVPGYPCQKFIKI